MLNICLIKTFEPGAQSLSWKNEEMDAGFTELIVSSLNKLSKLKVVVELDFETGGMTVVVRECVISFELNVVEEICTLACDEICRPEAFDCPACPC